MLDTLIVPGGWGVNAACEDGALVDWVRRRAGEAPRTASVCSGAFLLATAGLLDGAQGGHPLGALHRIRPDAFPPCSSIPTRSSSATATSGRRPA